MYSSNPRRRPTPAARRRAAKARAETLQIVGLVTGFSVLLPFVLFGAAMFGAAMADNDIAMVALFRLIGAM